jgi:hypothetical protein
LRWLLCSIQRTCITFDSTISLDAVEGASPHNLEILAASALSAREAR